MNKLTKLMMMMMKKKNQISSTSLLRDDHHMNKKRKVIGSSTSSCSTTTTTTVPNGGEEKELELPEDLIMEIFTHLPPISLLRFKSLSKTLHSLLSNHDFLRRNTVCRGLDPSPPPGILLKLGRASKIDVISHSGYDYYSQFLQNLIDNYGLSGGSKEKVEFTVIDSCNGLVLVRHNPPGVSGSWYVCNPITKDYIKLPPLQKQEQQQGLTVIQLYWWAKLVFDPSISLTYKVVIWLYELEIACRLYVYSSDTRSWKLSVSIDFNDFDFQVFQNQCYFYFRAVLLNGVLYYWDDADDFKVSLCYDVERDSVWTLKFPKMPVKYVRRKLFYIGVCGGGLRLIEKYYEHGYGKERPFPSSFDVMEINQLQLQQQYEDHLEGNMDNNNRDLWTVKYRVNIGDQKGYYANLIRENLRFGVCILDLYKTRTKAGGEVEEVLLCIKEGLVIIPFNLSDNTFGKELLNNELGLNHRFFSFNCVLRYAFTLFPLIH